MSNAMNLKAKIRNIAKQKNLPLTPEKIKTAFSMMPTFLLPHRNLIKVFSKKRCKPLPNIAVQQSKFQMLI